MGWRWLVVLLLVGCGRLRFADIDAGDDGSRRDDAPDDGGGGDMPFRCDRTIAITPMLYVDTNAGLDTNPGTASSRLKTINKALMLLPSGGGSIVVGPGNYGETLDVSTTVPIVLLSETRYAARIVRFNCQDCSDVTIDGFEITGAGVSLVSVTNGTNIVIRDNAIYQGNSAGIRVTLGSTNIDIASNVIWDTFASPIHVNVATNVHIRNNVVFFSTGTPTSVGKIWLEASTNTDIRNNVVYRALGDDNSYGMISLRDTQGLTTVENNVVGGSPNATDVYASVGFDMATGTAIIRHNTFIGPQPGTAFGVGAGALFGGNYQLVNNLWASAGTAQPFTDGTPPAGALTLRHNLYWNGPNGPFAGGGAPTPANDVEAIVANPGASSTLPPAPIRMGTGFAGGATTSCEVHDQLVDAMAKIASTSAAVGVADPSQSPAYDIRGHARPSPAALGAYQP